MSSNPGSYNVNVTASYLTEKKTITTTTTVYPTGGKITGNGNIPSASFSITGQYSSSDGTAQGSINYKDKTSSGLSVKSTQISRVGTTLDKRKGVITGFAQVNGAGSYYFEVYVEDNNEPETADIFRISLPTYPYANGDTLTSGNIQIS